MPSRFSSTPSTDPFPLLPRPLLLFGMIIMLFLQMFSIAALVLGLLKDPVPPTTLKVLAAWLGFPTLLLTAFLASYARKNGRDGKWGLMGLLSFIGVIIVLSLPPRPANHRPQSATYS